MIQFLNCQDHSYSYVLELTIRKQNQYKEIQDGIQKSPNPSKTELFSNQTALDHSKSENVCQAPTVIRVEFISLFVN